MEQRNLEQTEGLQIFKAEDGQFVTDSREVAKMIGKRHDHLMRDIKGYTRVLEDAPKLGSHNFFIESTYISTQNKEQPCYLLTRKGCDMVANKMTGEKGVLFTAEYVTRFEEMEKELVQPKSAVELLELQVKALKEVKDGISNVKKDFKILENRVDKKVVDLEENMPLFNVECDELQKLVRSKGISILGGYKTPAYNDRSVRARVYYDIQGQIKREFGINTYKAIKRKHFSSARDLVNDYTAPFILENLVYKANAQQEV